MGNDQRLAIALCPQAGRLLTLFFRHSCHKLDYWIDQIKSNHKRNSSSYSFERHGVLCVLSVIVLILCLTSAKLKYQLARSADSNFPLESKFSTRISNFHSNLNGSQRIPARPPRIPAPPSPLRLWKQDSSGKFGFEWKIEIRVEN